MKLGWKHLAGFIVVSAAVFALGMANGRDSARRGGESRPSEATFEVEPAGQAGPMRRMTRAESTFIHEVPAYPRSIGPEIQAGEFRDAFGFEGKAKTLNTKDRPQEVLYWYDQTFRMKSFNVYHVENDAFTGLGAIDTLRKQMYYVSIAEGRGQTQVHVAWVDGTTAPNKSTQLIPLDLGEAQPVMLTGDGRSHEMAVYSIDGAPGDAYARFGQQLESRGWKAVAPPSEEMARRLRDHQRSYVLGDRELLMTANMQGDRTVLMCMVSPRAG